MKKILTKNKLTILTLALFSILTLFHVTSLFAAEEGKEPEKLEEKNKELIELYQQYLHNKQIVYKIQEIGTNANKLQPGMYFTDASLSLQLKILLNNIFLAASFRNNIHFIKFFLLEGADVNLPHSRTGKTALFDANSREIVQLLLDARADVNAKQIAGTNAEFHNTIGSSALHHASASDRCPLEVIEILSENMDVMHIPVDDNGDTPLDYLCKTIENDTQHFFFPKAATLLWWSHAYQFAKARNYLPEPETAPLLSDGFNAIVYDAKCARDKFPLAPSTTLKAFNQFMHESAKNQLLLLIDKTLPVNSNISKIIMDYTCKYTPFPIYPALAYREDDDELYIPNTRHIKECKKNCIIS